MTHTLYWLQAGGCGGDTMSLLCAEAPNVIELFKLLDINTLWHPSLSSQSPIKRQQVQQKIVSGEEELDFLIVEGAVLRGPSGTGRFDLIDDRPKKDVIIELAVKAKYVIAIGTCAAYGGISGAAETEACGMQFTRGDRGGLLANNYLSAAGLPVINLSGCPCHPAIITGVLAHLVNSGSLELNEFNMPLPWYNTFVHQGCTRNEYHEYRVEDRNFGERGCMFFHLGCQGPLTLGVCNKTLWNRRSSKTRVGVPCHGCAQPGFPQKHDFFQTPNIEGLPFNLPVGVDRARYLACKGLAAVAAPQRLINRETDV
jgi:uptake hydrogenase small subunit